MVEKLLDRYVNLLENDSGDEMEVINAFIYVTITGWRKEEKYSINFSKGYDLAIQVKQLQANGYRCKKATKLLCS